ncbi:unnamed protein product [Rotaria sp. Silwood2]|nr:unnamed protein product [Rotaria sp. Silwood2]CAF4618506.1 unnamed protein product [Rotaria sp. Silwood2]CAF4742652.1 unnamed protein product [Rotaria sp. Silwood2]CAF4850939.1 unnamed protein product [Rotaria sp. Silwood2]
MIFLLVVYCGITTVIVSHPIETILIQRKINSSKVYRNTFHPLQLIYQRQRIINEFVLSFLETPIGLIFEQIHENLNRQQTHDF